jgi:hypothetical protein
VLHTSVQNLIVLPCGGLRESSAGPPMAGHSTYARLDR